MRVVRYEPSEPPEPPKRQAIWQALREWFLGTRSGRIVKWALLMIWRILKHIIRDAILRSARGK